MLAWSLMANSAGFVFEYREFFDYHDLDGGDEALGALTQTDPCQAYDVAVQTESCGSVWGEWDTLLCFAYAIERDEIRKVWLKSWAYRQCGRELTEAELSRVCCRCEAPLTIRHTVQTHGQKEIPQMVWECPGGCKDLEYVFMAPHRNSMSMASTEVAFLSDVGTSEAVIDTACTKAMGGVPWMRSYEAEATRWTGEATVPEHTKTLYSFAGGKSGAAEYAMSTPTQLGSVVNPMSVEVGKEFANTPCSFGLPNLENAYVHLYFSPGLCYMGSEALDMPLQPVWKNAHGLLCLDLLGGAEGNKSLAAYRMRNRTKGTVKYTDDKEMEMKDEESSDDEEEQGPEKKTKVKLEQALDPANELTKEYLKSFHLKLGHAPPWRIAKVSRH